MVQQAITQEKFLVRVVQQHTPVVQTYIQHLRPDPQLDKVPVSDLYMLGRVNFDNAFTNNIYAKNAPRNGWFPGSKSFLNTLSKAFSVQYSPNGFMDMIFLDAGAFDQQHYDFAFVRKEFLGDVRTMVFDVQPKPHTGMGRFIGRVWIEDQDGFPVRFTGTFTSDSKRAVYFHFDSWRANVQPHVWAPIAVYVEDQDFRAQTYLWGYSLKLPDPGSDNTSITVENAIDASDSSQDVGPVQAKRQWMNQTERNVLDRLTQAGLLANPSAFDKVLETVTNNLIIGNKIDLPTPIRCRVMPTASLESLAVGNTIIISKGLVDVLPSEESLAAVLSFQLAHILLGHQIDTRYAFNDRLLFPDEATLQRIAMNHSDADNESAAKRAVELLRNSIYQDKLASANLFFMQITQLSKNLPSLLTPRLGDSLMRPGGTPWMSGISNGTPALQIDNLQQIAALPLNSHLRIDPWSDEVYQLSLKPQVLLNVRDKMPLEVTPIYYRLTRYSRRHRPREPGWLDRPRARRRARRARRAQLPAVRHVQRPARRGGRRVPVARLELARGRARHPRDDGRSWPSAFRPASPTRSRSTPRAPVTAGIREIVETLLEAVALVVLVVFIFLQSWRATLIPLLTVPVSLIGAFAVFPLFGFSVNTLSLFGLVLAIGLVVDDAIVVVEAVEHHIEEGMAPRDATLAAMKQVQGPVIAIALILAAVFVPVAFMSGIIGRLYQQFALTIAISVLISAFNALTLSPALAALLLRPRSKKRGVFGRLGDRFNRGFGRATERLRVASTAGSCASSSSRSFLLAGVAALSAFDRPASCRPASSPTRTRATRSIGVQLPDGASLQRTKAVFEQINADPRPDQPGIATYNGVAGFSLFTRTAAPYTGARASSASSRGTSAAAT